MPNIDQNQGIFPCVIVMYKCFISHNNYIILMLATFIVIFCLVHYKGGVKEAFECFRQTTLFHVPLKLTYST